jgi:hypothetical protein
VNRPRPTPGAVANLCVRMAALRCPPHGPVTSDGAIVERVRVLVAPSTPGRRYGPAMALPGDFGPDDAPTIRIRAL